MKNCAFYLLFVLVAISCNQSSHTDQKKNQERDTTINVKNSFNPRFLDSTELETFLKSHQENDSLANRLREFYAQRNYQYAWFTDSGFAEYGLGFAEMLDNYLAYSKDSSLYNQQLHNVIDSFSANPQSIHPGPELLKTELLLSTQFFRYAYRVYEGRNFDQKDLGWFIPKKKVNPVAVLDSMIASNTRQFATNEPLNPQYNLLKNALLKYYTIRNKLDSLATVSLPKNKTDTYGTQNLKKHLYLLGDLSLPAYENDDKDSLLLALKRFQNRHGLAATGVLNAATVTCINQPSQLRIDQMLINLERLKWVPIQSSLDYIVVNIPEFRLYVYEKGNYKWNMKVVVGTDANSTVIFMGTLKYIVFSPYWNVPPSIIKKEILPGIRKNKNYLEKHNMEWNNGLVRQKPGPKNSLGLVKFLFPNSYNIYLHDTPSKSLFNDSKRAFSHGCIRIAEPTKLAEFILRNDSSWTKEKIVQAMNAGKEKYVKVKDMMPVFIGYFTAWVDRQGILNFRDDIYGHDKKMAEILFVKD
jgi:murein L,D-transpeptidase YcbB/YkuD